MRETCLMVGPLALVVYFLVCPDQLRELFVWLQMIMH